ncbi:hypothetical protein BH23CHL8_BH23CHL8_23550 [soil metagenome]
MDGARDGAEGTHQAATRFAVVFLALATLVVSDGLIPAVAEGSGLGSSIASTRRSQANAERAMRKADERIATLKRARGDRGKRAKAAVRRLERMRDRRTAVRRRATSTSGRLRLARLDLGRQLAVRPDPSGVQSGSRPTARRDVKRLRAKVRQLERTTRKVERKARKALREKRLRSHSKAQFRQRIEGSATRREAAEARLGTAIRRMVGLAQARASRRSSVGPARTGFRKPARGSVTQRFGCTAAKRGRCLRFHDGVDIAAPSGTRIVASATGVVAYVGWSPWDRGRRAFIVIIGHPGGFESLYGHLLPVRRVRAGQRVRRGQVIGLMGSTGHSSGPHVHWEVRRGSKIIDPLRFR